MAKSKTKQQLIAENEELRSRLQELEDTLEAIRSGTVDAIVAAGPEGDRVYTLQGANHAYLTMVESMSEGAVTLMTDGTILYANRQFGRMTGAPPSEIVGRRFHDFVSAQDQSVTNEILRGEGAAGFKMEIHLVRGAADEIPVRVSASPIELDGSEALTLVVTDLSERKKLEDIAAAEQLSRRILEQAHEAIAVCIDGHIVRANRALYEICGSIPLMQPFDQVFSFQVPESQPFSVAIPESGKTIRSQEARYQRPDGTSFDLLLSAGPLFGSRGEVLGSLISLMDVTGLKQAEREIAKLNRELQQKIQNLEAIFETAPVGLAITEDPEGLHIRGNVTNERILGAPRGGELSKRPDVDSARYRAMEHGREMAVEELPMQRAVRGKIVSNMIIDIVREDGSAIKLLSNAAPLLDVQGRPRGAVGAFLDITELARAQGALRESEERYRSLFDSMTEGFAIHEIVTDAEGRPVNYRFLDVNASFERLTGLKRENIIGRVITEVLPGEDSEWIAMFGKVALTGEPVKVEKRSTALDRWYEAFAYRPAPRQFAVVFMDITARKKAETALEEARFVLSEGQRIAHVGTFEYVAATRTTVWSDEECRIYGLSPGDASPDYDVMLEKYVHPDDAAMLHETFSAAMKSRSVYELEHRIVRPDGSVRTVYDLAHPYFDNNGELVRYVGATLDITERKASEEALRESERQLRQASDLLDTVTRGTNVIIATQDANQRYTYFNRAYAEEIKRLTGRELHIGSSMAELFEDMPEQWDIAVREWRRPLGGEVVSKTVEFGDPDRHRRVYRSLQTPLYDDAGAIVGAGEVALDITDQVQAREALQRSEARFRLLSETAGRLLASEDPQGLIESLCRQVMGHLDCQAFFNFMVDERAGRLRLNACAGIPEEEVRKLEWLDYGIAVCGCVARDGVRIIAEDIFHTPDTRTELVKSYGIQAYCCHPMKVQDRLLGMLSFGTKTRARFTEEEVEVMRTVADQVAVALQRIEANRELSVSRQRLQMALDAGGMGTWSLDLQSNLTVWNLKEYELLGLPAGRGIEDPETFYRLVHPEDLPGLQEAYRDALADRGSLQQEFRVIRPGGDIRWLTSLGRVISDEAGQPVSFTGVSYDFTHLKEREAELRKLNRMLRALSNSSHAQARAEEEAAYLEEVCQIVVRDCGYAMVWIAYAENDEDKTVRPVAHAGFEDGYLGTLRLTWADRERGRGPTGTAIREARSVICPDMLTDSRLAPWRDEALRRGYASSLALPLMSEGKAFGAVTIYSGEPNPFTQDEVTLLTELADDLTRGITMLRLKRANREAREALQRSKDELEERVRDRTAEISLLLGEVEKSRDALRRLASELVMAEEQERKRIAVTLHDEVAQTLAAAKMRLDMLKNMEGADDYGRVVREIRDLLAQSIRETRSLMTDISSPVLYDMGLASAVQAMADQASADSGIAVSCLFRGELKDLGTESVVMVHHVVKELLQNIVKHSEARSASIRIAREGSSVRTVVADNGRGFDGGVGSPGQEGGFGLFSIRERVRSFEGDLHIESRPGKGTVVTVTMPVHEGDRDRETAPAKEGAPRKGRKTRTP